MLAKWFRIAYQVIARILVRFILFFVGSVKITGRENIPPKGPYLIITNHLSMVDSPLILLSFPIQQMRVFAANKWHKHPIFGPILGLSGAIWVRRGEVDRIALGNAMAALKNGQVIGMAPEGTRSRSKVLQKARQGPAYIASKAQVKIIPVGLINTDRFKENITHLRRSHFQVKVGKPFTLPELDHRPRSKDLEAFSEYLMVHIASLLPERYYGYYADSPALKAILAGEDPWPACIARTSE
jgi:1-acyl-sn-glycerol-3-phosphate acyltransferase